MTLRQNPLWATLVIALGLVLAGCAVSDPSRYYALTTLRAPSAVSPAATDTTLTIGVGPVAIPAYLDRTHLVTRDPAGALEIWPYHLWAEPLDVGIAQALAEGLAARIPSDRIAVFPWRGAMARTIDYQVVVVVVRFDGSPGRNVTLDARWRLLNREGKELAFKRTVLTEPVGASGIPALIDAMNQEIDGLGQAISHEIQAQSINRAATKD